MKSPTLLSKLSLQQNAIYKTLDHKMFVWIIIWLESNAIQINVIYQSHLSQEDLRSARYIFTEPPTTTEVIKNIDTWGKILIVTHITRIMTGPDTKGPFISQSVTNQNLLYTYILSYSIPNKQCRFPLLSCSLAIKWRLKQRDFDLRSSFSITHYSRSLKKIYFLACESDINNRVR